MTERTLVYKNRAKRKPLLKPIRVSTDTLNPVITVASNRLPPVLAGHNNRSVSPQRIINIEKVNLTARGCSLKQQARIKPTKNDGASSRKQSISPVEEIESAIRLLGSYDRSIFTEELLSKQVTERYQPSNIETQLLGPHDHEERNKRGSVPGNSTVGFDGTA